MERSVISRTFVLGVAVILLATSLTAPATEVPVFIFAGQSNAVGTDSHSELTPAQTVAQPTVLFYGPNESGATWAPLTPSNNSPNVGGSFGPEISTGKTISAGQGGAVVAEVKYAVGGTNLYDQWNPDTGNNLYSNMIARVQQSLADLQTQQGVTGKVAGFFWMQGESDAGRTDYAANLTNLIAKLRANPVIKNPNLPFVFGQIIDYSPPASTSLRAQQQLVADTVSNTAFIHTDDLGHNDFIHFSGQGIYTMGQRFGNGYLSLVPEPNSLGLLAAGLLLIRRRRVSYSP